MKTIFYNLKASIVIAFVCLVQFFGCKVPEKDYPLTKGPVYPVCVLTAYDIVDTAKFHAGAQIRYDAQNRIIGIIALDSLGNPSARNSVSVLYPDSNGNSAIVAGRGSFGDSTVFNYSGKWISESLTFKQDGSITHSYYTYDSVGRLRLKVNINNTTVDSIYQTFGALYRPVLKIRRRSEAGAPSVLMDKFKYEYDANLNLVTEQIFIQDTAYTSREYQFDPTKPAVSKVLFVNSEDPNLGSKDRNIHLLQSVTKYEQYNCGVISPKPVLAGTIGYKYINFNQEGFADSVYISVTNPCDLTEQTVKAKMTYRCK